MALRIPWDIEEAVLMLDMLLKSLDGKLTRKEAIRQVSEKLRRRAVNRGITIDDIFRNENGITFQMSALEVAYTGRKTKLKQPTKLFVETVNLYRNHRELYEEILKEAENVVEPTSVQDKFCSYLSMQMPTFQLSDAYLMLSDIESFCLERKILQNKLFETTDLETIKRVVQTVDSNRVFRFTYKQNLKKMSTVIHAYYTFLKSYKPDEEKEAKLIIQEAIPSLPDADSMKQKDDAVIPQDISVPATERTKLTDLEERQKFNDWMLSSGMSKATIASYMSSFGQCVKSVANYKLCETSLWNVSNAEDASHIYDQLFGISEFYEYNKQQHNRFSAAFRKFIEYRSGGSPASLKPSQPARFAIEKMPTRRQENDPVLIRYKELLDKYFQKGFRMELGVDMLSASAHKFNGPKGIGFIYIKSGTKIFPYADGGAQEHGMRAGTENIASIVGMAAALKKNCDHMDQTQNKLHQLEDKFLDVLKLSGIDFTRNGSANHIPGNVNVSIRNVSGEMLLHRLDLKGIAISTGSACDSVNTQVSHVIQAIRVPKEYAHGTIRVSFGRDNEESDAVEIAKAIVDILKTK